MVSFTHEQNSICSQKQLKDIAHEHTIICKQLFAGHVVGSRPMKRKKHLHRMITSSTKNEKSKDYCKADLKRVLFFIAIFRLAIPAFFRITDVTEIM